MTINEPGDPDRADDETVDDTVMELLHDHVPLTLLVDLADAPASEQVLREEGLPDQRWWEHLPRQPGGDD